MHVDWKLIIILPRDSREIFAKRQQDLLGPPHLARRPDLGLYEEVQLSLSVSRRSEMEAHRFYLSRQHGSKASVDEI